MTCFYRVPTLARKKIKISSFLTAEFDAYAELCMHIFLQAGERRGKGGENSRDDDSSDDGSSYRDDEDDETSDEDEAITVGKLKDLEWDNSTLA